MHSIERMVIKMKGTGRGHFEGRLNTQKGQNVQNFRDESGIFLENEWEASEELTPDPYAEEEHSQIHSPRFSQHRLQNPGSKRK